jgi:large subunit ribosomal protein L18
VNKEKLLNRRRIRRAFRVRKKFTGSAEKPRLSVDRSLKHIAVQIIDDVAGKTLVSASTRDAETRGKTKYGGNKDAASSIGKLIAERALAAGISQVQFDRGDNRYHGRVAALAEAAREAGLKF